MKRLCKRSSFLLFGLGLAQCAQGQVAINADGSAPDSGAMLDIVSTDKGLLIPRMTATAMQQLGSPSTPTTGLWIFNTTADAFYYYDGTAWKELGEQAPDGDTDATNELQNLGNSASGTDRTVTISSGTGTSFSVADNDNSATNELQNLGSSASGTNRTVTISDGTSTTFSVVDLDNSTSNELQSLSQSGTTVTLSNGGGSINVTDDDTDTSNELQNLGSSLSGSTQTLTLENGGQTSFDLADNDASSTNELDSKWTNGTNNSIYYNSGNVGIGVPQSAQKLDIEGLVRIHGGSPADGKVLTASDTTGTSTWEYPSVLNAFYHEDSEANTSFTEDGWEELTGSASVDDVLVGDRFLVIISFRCSLKGLGGGSDDFSFRVGANKSSSSSSSTWTSPGTGLIQTIDQHRAEWHAFQLHRVLEIDQAGHTRFYLEVKLDAADDTLYSDDIHVNVIRL